MKITKIKPLSKDQLIISIDRLTRFKEPEVKYMRVFSDILASNLIIPKLKKSEMERIDYHEITRVVEEIINSSLKSYGIEQTDNYTINNKIYEYENTIFKIDKNTEILLKNKINYDGFVNLITEDAPKNLQWLKAQKYVEDIKSFRQSHLIKYPIEKVVIVEGATEETLLPEFARRCDYDFDKNGVYILSAGGKNQVVKLYYSLVEKLKIPIFVLLDKDAKQNQEYINYKLRPQDSIHLLSCGEFEDLLPMDLVKRTLEYELNNISMVEQEMLKPAEPRVKILEEIFKTRGMHEFKKVEFAQMVRSNIAQESDISAEIREIINGIEKLK